MEEPLWEAEQTLTFLAPHGVEIDIAKVQVALNGLLAKPDYAHVFELNQLCPNRFSVQVYPEGADLDQVIRYFKDLGYEEVPKNQLSQGGEQA